ncbi:DUF6924 domain-containing protein [Streptomyces sp. NPDC058746]|uniref:DUF6924 domain-containing protein n=1 Tax=Streptomyces sp. NPDC058746 TaxID=3346622 RepID=UPI0036AB1B7D
MTTLLVRTDFTQPHAWQTLLTTVQTPNSHGFLAETVTIDDPAYRDLPPGFVGEFQERLMLSAGNARFHGRVMLPSFGNTSVLASGPWLCSARRRGRGAAEVQGRSVRGYPP